MVSPQTENGYTRISNELLEAIMRFGFSKQEMQVLLAVIRKTYGFGKQEDDLGITQLARMTGLQHTHTAKAVRDLVEKNVLHRNKGHYAHKLGVIKDCSKWGIKTMTDSVIPTMTDSVIPTMTDSVIPTMTDSVIPTMTDSVIPTMTDSVIPTMTDSVIPTMTDSVIGGDGFGHRGMTESVRGGVTDSVSTKENQPKENPKRKPPLQNKVLTGEKNLEENKSGGGDFLSSKNTVLSSLIFPKNLTQKEQLEAEKLLVKCDGQAQEILDTLEASIRAGEVKKSPLALLGGIVRRYKAGTFDPTPGMHVAIERQKQQASKQAVEAITSHAVVMQKLNAMNSSGESTADSPIVEKLKTIQKKRAQNKNIVSQ